MDEGIVCGTPPRSHPSYFTYDKAKTERDKLAAELADTYPAIARQLSELLTRIAANAREIEYINTHALPSDGERLFVAELVAPGLI